MGLGIKDKSQTMDLLDFYQILIQTMELLGFLPISNSNSRFIFSGEISSSHYYSVQDFPEIFLVNHKENVSFHIIAKNDKRNSHISSWP